ncbi:MAG: 23S rRNA (uracil(1939)-C(5))-methyltransferase RlmD [Ndongobacter sp.]|nr:23S rRNA (uracil(1939)-C(5))-methyltransferase RlmD [Ndongobacter sp.]
MEKGQRFEASVTDWTGEGRGVAKWEGQVVFVKGALPGDRCLVEVDEQKKHFALGHVVEWIERSEKRRPAPCIHAAACDGCGLMELSYSEQLKWKKTFIEQSLHRIGQVSAECAMLSAAELGYRNKLNCRLLPSGELAFSRRGSNHLFPVSNCAVAQPELQQLMRRWQEGLAVQPRFRALSAAVRMVLLRANQSGETMIVLITDPVPTAKRQELLAVVGQYLPATVLCAGENRRPGDVRVPARLFFATERTFLEEELCGLRFRISPASFFQVNRYTSRLLYGKAMELFSDIEGERILDLYCGTGTTSLLLSQKAAYVYGVEVVPAAVADAKQNARRNRRGNVQFICAKAEEILPKLVSECDAHMVLVDPPRKGLDARVVEAITRADIREMVYISCNPTTMARDVRRLSEGGFSVRRVIGIDQFPNSGNAEAICLMSRTKE